jgi:signal transduction histidine kinase
LVDKRLLRQIVTNLISNALKYSPNEGVVQVTLACRTGDFFLIVQDQGVGIPVADRELIFDPFQRGSNVAGVAGKGLGLAIVKQAVSLHGGSIDLDSRPGEGAKVTVTLPIPTSSEYRQCL